MKTTQFSPFVYWAQTETRVTLKVDLKDVTATNIELRSKELIFSAYGVGARGENQYTFSIDFFSDVNTTTSNYKIIDSKVDFTIQKAESGWWPRVTAQPQKPLWLKIDFDRWCSEDDGDEEEETRDIMTDYPGLYDKLHREEYGYRKEQGRKVYLMIYNLCQFIGFLYIMLVLSIRYYRDGPSSMSSTYESVGNAYKFCQLLQYLEVMHPMFGYTKGSCIVPLLQVSGRTFILFAMIDAEPRMQTKPVVFYLFLLWATIEVIRYPYYISTIIKRELKILTWIRYTIWIPLYPMGIVCEGIIVLRNISYFEETQLFTVTMPNVWNFTFYMPIFMKVYLLVLTLPGMYFLMNHMAKARNKQLGRKDWRKIE